MKRVTYRNHYTKLHLKEDETKELRLEQDKDYEYVQLTEEEAIK